MTHLKSKIFIEIIPTPYYLEAELKEQAKEKAQLNEINTQKLANIKIESHGVR